MIRLDKTLHAWGTPGFEAVLKQEVAQLGADQLPLQQGLSGGNYVTADPFTVVVNSIDGMEHMLRVRVGIFYQGVIGGCSCADDPTPTSESNEYCEVQLDIDRTTAVTAVTLLT